MRKLSFLIYLVLISGLAFGQSPHTDALKIDCSQCHNSVDWKVNPSKIKFDHSTTGFALAGQHLSADCKSCHSSLVFNEASPECISCHKDIHQNTVGPDCQRCHSPTSWLVTNINQIHEESRFPLIGVHLNADCAQCHGGYQNLYFEQLSIDCVSCHRNDYNSTTSPNHITAGFSTDCQDCHNINSFTWAAENFNHDFFPLIGGHNIQNCFSCHQSGRFTGLSTECYSCHRKDYEQVQDPNHLANNYPTDCTLCHSINGWSPANFNHNNTQFPLTGAHQNVDCSKCHSQSFAGTPTACVECHRSNYNATVNPNHVATGISSECETCHNTTAWVPSSFTHSSTGFELVGQHSLIDCLSCHKGTTSGLSPECVSCHQADYDATVNPNHKTLSISTDCQTCHTPSPNWQPATFPIHNNYYELLGAHATIASDCNTCHNGNYTSTPNTCYGCHQTDYNNTNDPPHASAGFSTDCVTCHSQSAWKPSTFDHDNQFFPIYSGKHNGQWNTCSDCHTNASDYSVFSCINCHEHNQTDADSKHQGVSGYSYNSQACYACHPTGSSEGSFNHSLSSFPLTGAHLTVACIQCHQQGYSGTSTVCYDCHQSNYNSTTNPNHLSLSISTNCSDCHSTEAGWAPASFPQHSQYFEFTGAHLQIASDCNNCHSGNYNLSLSGCVTCHNNAYNSSVNPNHSAAGISTSCESCHNTNAWIPSTFVHSSTGFELSGQHASIQCSSCHKGTTSGLNNLCISCHQDKYNSAPNHTSQGYPTNCEMCHNSVDWSQVNFNHQTTNFPLTGEHLNVSCSGCHSTGFAGTTTVCSGCHQSDYNSTTNPSHTSLALPTTCENCHTINANWKPAEFPIHNNYYQLLGAHASIPDCNSCHNGNYNSTPNTCYGCHQADYNTTNNPSHQTAGFPLNCESCHSQSVWQPSTFDHDNQYFPIYSGRHQNAWNQCSDCHANAADFTVFSCIDCHEHNQTETDGHHSGVSGYVYNSDACYNCHPRGRAGLLKKIMINK